MQHTYKATVMFTIDYELPEGVFVSAVARAIKNAPLLDVIDLFVPQATFRVIEMQKDTR